MKPYRELTRRGRLRRLRRVAGWALAAYGLTDARLRFVQHSENAIYRVDAPRHAALAGGDGHYLANRYVLRIHAMNDEEAIASEITWLIALSREGGLPVPAPVPTPDGEHLVRIVAPEIPHGKIVTLLRWLDARRLERGLRPAHLAALGQTVARLHTFAAAWQPPAGFTRPHWDWDSQLGGSMFDEPREELVASMPARFREPFEAVSQAAKEAMAALGKGPEAYGLIHADLYPENVLFRAGQAYPIDFEDCGYGYWMWDIAVALCRWAWGAEWERMRDAFRGGYAQIRTLPEAQWAQLDLFVATQFATMVLWASAFLKHDPIRVGEYEPWRDDNGDRLLRYPLARRNPSPTKA